MWGDFSKRPSSDLPNINGVLYQQGRVLVDTDGTAQTVITNKWQDTAARHVIGAGVVAVPVEEGDAFRVLRAAASTDEKVNIWVGGGQGWIDGMLVHLPSDGTFLATKLEISSLAVPDSSSRDAVVLEVWREALNAFQMPDDLIEPALGGPDTTERVRTAMRFRLLRIGKNDTCRDVAVRLKEYDIPKGTLTAFLPKDVATSEECPVVEGGGYTGFEHSLYRIEIAEVNKPADAKTMFKWSQFNGGLVGRGTWNQDEITITANLQAIANSGLDGFYLEAVEWDDKQGYFRVTYGAEVTLDGDILHVGNVYYKDPLPEQKSEFFFRLWNGIRFIDEFGPGDATQLQHNIRLEFDPENDKTYIPGDYWTFEVRADEAEKVAEKVTLIGGETPEGIQYHRAPLAILEWHTSSRRAVLDRSGILDCRDVFLPLTGQTGCCTFMVGDGKHSFGDFNSIQDALDNLPSDGGQICLLPGDHRVKDAIVIDGDNIIIKGCGDSTIVEPKYHEKKHPVFTVKDRKRITLEDMYIASFGGGAIVMEGTEAGALGEIEICNNRIVAYENAISVAGGVSVHIHHNKIGMVDRKDGDVAVYLMAEDCVVERNDIVVIPADFIPAVETPESDTPVDLSDNCIDLRHLNLHNSLRKNLLQKSKMAFELIIANFTPILFIDVAPLGGVQISAGSERIRILENRIIGGSGNGITLGGVKDFDTLVDSGAFEERGFEFSFQSPLKAVMAVMPDGRTPAEGKKLRFRKSDGTSDFDTTVDEKGRADLGEDFRPGTYTVSVVDPSYIVENIEDIVLNPIERSFTIVRYTLVTLAKVEKPSGVDEALAFIYDIQIDGNEISNMGLSGIGLVPIAPEVLERNALTKILELAGNPIFAIAVRMNTISGCLQGALNSYRSIAQKMGVGGISLGECNDVVISGNRIDNNGASHINPVCGIYIADGEHVEISHNLIVRNGPFVANAEPPIEPGIRGGIVVTASSLSTPSMPSAKPVTAENVVIARSISAPTGLEISDDSGSNPGSDSIGNETPENISHIRSNLSGSFVYTRPLTIDVNPYPSLRPTLSVSAGRPAIRLHDNVVDQPAGRALTIEASGPVSVQNNSFNSELAGPESKTISTGVVLIQNLGRLHWAGVGKSPQIKLELLDGPDDAGAGGMLINAERLLGHGGFTRISDTAEATDTAVPVSELTGVTINTRGLKINPVYGMVPELIPFRSNGNTLFCNNHTRMGIECDAEYAQRISSAGDVGFEGNQSDAFGRNLMCNTWIKAETLRATNGRYREIFDANRPVIISLETEATDMNNTSNNQVDHCILAESANDRLEKNHNQVLNPKYCDQIGNLMTELLTDLVPLLFTFL